MKGETNPRNTRCKKPIMTGLSPNTALPTPVKMVRLCKIIFRINAPIDNNIIYRKGPLTNLDSLKTCNEDMINEAALAKTRMLPAAAMIRKVSLGACHRKDRNNDGKVDRQSNNANQ